MNGRERRFGGKGITLLCAAFFVFGIGAFVMAQFRPASAGAAVEVFVVDEPTPFSDVLAAVYESGLSRNLWTLWLSALFARTPPDVAAGSYEISSSMAAWQIVGALAVPAEQTVTLAGGLSKDAIAQVFGDALGWSAHEKKSFVGTYRAMQWDAFKNVLSAYLRDIDWLDADVDSFTARYSSALYDLFPTAYAAGDYILSRGASFAELAAMLNDRATEEHAAALESFVGSAVDQETVDAIEADIRAAVELLPDISPLPPSDLTLSAADGRTLLLFTATYWNHGDGPLELVADPGTADAEGDVARDIYQYIHRTDGEVRTRLAGSFLWHEEHLHYHFSDFAYYDLVPVDADGEVPDDIPRERKATFCVRDVSLVDERLVEAPQKPVFAVCGKERQGVSVGWGDSYFYTYADQNLDMTDYPSGTYRLTITINPLKRFDELSYDNNVSSTLFRFDADDGSVEVLEEEGGELPHGAVVRHINVTPINQ